MKTEPILSKWITKKYRELKLDKKSYVMASRCHKSIKTPSQNKLNTFVHLNMSFKRQVTFKHEIVSQVIDYV